MWLAGVFLILLVVNPQYVFARTTRGGSRGRGSTRTQKAEALRNAKSQLATAKKTLAAAQRGGNVSVKNVIGDSNGKPISSSSAVVSSNGLRGSNKRIPAEEEKEPNGNVNGHATSPGQSKESTKEVATEEEKGGNANGHATSSGQLKKTATATSSSTTAKKTPPGQVKKTATASAATAPLPQLASGLVLNLPADQEPPAVDTAPEPVAASAPGLPEVSGLVMAPYNPDDQLADEEESLATDVDQEPPAIDTAPEPVGVAVPVAASAPGLPEVSGLVMAPYKPDDQPADEEESLATDVQHEENLIADQGLILAAEEAKTDEEIAALKQAEEDGDTATAEQLEGKIAAGEAQELLVASKMGEEEVDEEEKEEDEEELNEIDALDIALDEDSGKLADDITS